MLPEGTMISAFIGGAISKVINDGVDYTKPKIKSVINDRHDQNISTKICRVIERALNIITDNVYKNSDDLYDAIEKIFIEFKKHSDTFESVKCGLGILYSDVSNQRCENFLERFYEGIRRDDDLYKEVIMFLQQKGIRISQEEFQKLNEKLDNLTEIVSREYDNKINIQKRETVKSRTQEYADIWNKNMFLNNFDKREENAGINVKLGEVYLEEHLPHYILGSNKESRSDLKELLSEYIIDKRENNMLLILGQPGIGKSTLITWIAANFVESINNILVYKFASDLKGVDWQENRITDRILEELDLTYEELEGKTLIIDGFDEVNVGDYREEILDSLYGDLIYKNKIKNFSLIITCRLNYVRFEKMKCKYIILQIWEKKQIESFCTVYHEKTKSNITQNTIDYVIKNREILGVPLILYMVLALNISIENEASIVDVYDKIFCLEGGIYDRCIDNKYFSEKHRIAEIKEQIHQISRDIAMWMFENNSEEASIPQKEYQKICSSIMQEQQMNKENEHDFLIGNFFKLVKHCEGMETEELYFIHRSIYEYFVVETIYSSIENAMIKLTDESQKELAGKIVNYLKQGIITNTIKEYLQYKLLKFYNSFCSEKGNKFYQWWEGAVEKLIDNGMFYYTGKNVQQYKNIIDKEILCFLNLVKILRIVLNTSNREYMLKNVDKVQLGKYIRFRLAQCRMEERMGVEIFDLSKMSLEYVNLSGADIKMANLKRANLKGINLSNTNLSGIDLSGAILSNTNLAGADLTDANLSGANLTDANLIDANLTNVDLSGANLTDANLIDANLTNVDLSGANLIGANLINADLSSANLGGARFMCTVFDET